MGEGIMGLILPGYGSGYGSGSGDGRGSGYGDGSGYGYILNYINIFKWSSHQILTVENAELRKEMIKTVDIAILLRDLNAKTIDKQGNYELVNLSLNDGRYRPYLKMLNPSVRCWHIEGVHPNCKTIKEALVWRNQTDEEPVELT
jgi:hypothetical protein